ncbi:plastocyanin/azurin family copper-binding protein [Halobacterium sp. KA-6]|jgi:plastocyanin|uniref:plastocyanin/azurin family copper-binding protein n=1 Tax=Halobacterium sp. KA-6 TaxID=2896368 RepID=UPI001E38FF26|nr:plastocyanin/azurin family copper-binding protein [Halobacterium sp. KA-6]MCD2202280.1 plastocyanin/azurin family copper-binding protein [Halobacterium sp. KA-6]
MKRRDFLKIATGSAGGAAAIGAAGARSSSTSAAVQEGEGNNTTSGNATTDGSGSGEGEELPGAGTTKTVEVGPNGQNVFDPETVYVQRGATVEWVWRSAGHNVHATDVPEGADWDVQTEITGPEFTYSYTFDGPLGEYHYVCDPHEALGMVGNVVVNESGQAPGGEGGEAELNPEEMGVPFQAHFVGIATILMMIVSLVYAFFVLKYGESQNASAPNKE